MFIPNLVMYACRYGYLTDLGIQHTVLMFIIDHSYMCISTRYFKTNGVRLKVSVRLRVPLPYVERLDAGFVVVHISPTRWVDAKEAIEPNTVEFSLIFRGINYLSYFGE